MPDKIEFKRVRDFLSDGECSMLYDLWTAECRISPRRMVRCYWIHESSARVDPAHLIRRRIVQEGEVRLPNAIGEVRPWKTLHLTSIVGNITIRALAEQDYMDDEHREKVPLDLLKKVGLA